MSETTIAIDDEGSGDDKRKLVVLGGALGAVVLAAVGFYAFSGSGGGSEETAVSIPVARAANAAAPAAKAKAKALATVPEVASVRLGKDPFRALYVKPAPAAVVVAPAPGAGVPAGAGGSTPAAAGAPAPAGAPVPAKPAPYALRLTKVYGSDDNLTAAFTVGGPTQTAVIGEVFGKTGELKLLSLQQDPKGVWTAVVQVGDGQPFDAPVGQTLYVQ